MRRRVEHELACRHGHYPDDMSPRGEGSSPSPAAARFPTWRALPPPAWMPAGRRDECLDGCCPRYPVDLNLIES